MGQLVNNYCTVLYKVSFVLFFSELTKCPQESLNSFKFIIYSVKIDMKTSSKPILENHKIVLEFLTNRSTPFFRTCVSDSFHLLDIVDRIVQTVPNLTDPEETPRLSNHDRLTLMAFFKKGLTLFGPRRGEENFIEVCKELCNSRAFPRSSQLELKRLQAHFILSGSTAMEDLNLENLAYLLKLLEELVLVENEYRLAYHLMKVCVLVRGPRCYTLEQALSVCEKWHDFSPNDCIPYFYQMIIYFLSINEGKTTEFTAKYLMTLKAFNKILQFFFT